MRLSRRTLIQSLSALLASCAGGLGWAAAAPKPLAFLATGDWGMNGDHFQRQVAAAMGVWAERNDSRFVAAVGDNFYDAGVQSVSDPHWKRSFEDVYVATALQTPWYAILGNHDYGGVPQAQIDYSATSKRWRMPARYYSRSMATPDGASVDLFFIDTSPMLTGYRERKEDGPLRANVRAQDPAAQRRWLDAALAGSKAGWKLVFGHHPVFSGGVHGDTSDLVATLRPMLERHGVQAYICGHDHDLQHIERGGVTYVCTGAGATTRKVAGTAGSVFFSDKPGFTAYRLAAERLDIDFVGVDGRFLHTARVPRLRS
ncbi:MAG: acid phosphatase [Caulobacteraceae bacterium]|nr:acid phosphatase [Caulobacteraceae bacterium]